MDMYELVEKKLFSNLTVINLFPSTLFLQLSLGCYFHGCSCLKKRTIKQIKANELWEKKKQVLRSKGVEVRMMKECIWDKLLKNSNVNCTETKMARILKTDTEETLLQAIRDDSIFGFAVCSVKTRKSDIDEMIKVNKLNAKSNIIC